MMPLIFSGALLAALASAPAETSAQPELALPTASTTPVAVEDEKEKDGKWHGSVNIGATYADGNTNAKTIAASIDGLLEHEKDRHTTRAWWNYGSQKIGSDSQITVRNAGGSYKYDYFLNERTYAFAIAGAETDKLAALKLRWYAGGGIGHKFLDTEETKFDVELGVTYFSEDFEVNEDDTDYIAARAAYHYWQHISDTANFEQFAEIFPSLENGDDVYARVDSRVNLQVTENMFARLQHIFRWDNTPATGLERVDNQVIATLGWGF